MVTSFNEVSKDSWVLLFHVVSSVRLFYVVTVCLVLMKYELPSEGKC